MVAFSGRGAFVVSSSYTGSKGGNGGRAGVVGATTIVSERGSPCTLRRPQSWPKGRIAVKETPSGRTVPVTWTGEGAAEFFAFETTAGATYLLGIGTQ